MTALNTVMRPNIPLPRDSLVQTALGLRKFLTRHIRKLQISRSNTTVQIDSASIFSTNSKAMTLVAEEGSKLHK
ncbi:uncharacterized protein N7498_002121 [Penicillium cinerascens]|uniref:Uncharacterized protein n=1 Tax=Penicillium cinerascens TaxID=70096 RepID=A0A9W9N9J5_9EURO|nr:uncharacterized protein N7498_002121 [Penicillium cinerascens]KAJ5215714.1 hypothetical protein N7498_002121 [Penicillium cinerascens]